MLRDNTFALKRQALACTRSAHQDMGSTNVSKTLNVFLPTLRNYLVAVGRVEQLHSLPGCLLSLSSPCLQQSLGTNQASSYRNASDVICSFALSFTLPALHRLSAWEMPSIKSEKPQQQHYRPYCRHGVYRKPCPSCCPSGPTAAQRSNKAQCKL